MSAHLYEYTFTNQHKHGCGRILLRVLVPQQALFLFAFMAWCNCAEKLLPLPLRFVICVYVFRFEGGYQPVGPSERLVTTYQVTRCHIQKVTV